MLIILTMWTMLTMTIKMLETGGSPECGGQSESCEQNTLTELYWSSPSLLANIRKKHYYDDNWHFAASNDHHHDNSDLLI